MVKKHASDQYLGQDSETLVWKHVKPTFMFNIFLLSQPLEEAVLSFPHRYLQLMGPIPQVPRPLRAVKPAKRKSYLTLASILLKKVAMESTARSVRFLVALCTDLTPQPVPRLPWFEEEVENDQIAVGLPPAMGRLCPSMKFTVRLRG